LQLEELQEDISFIKSFFVAKARKKERRRRKKDAEQLAREEEEKAYEQREIYEEIVRRLDFRLWEFMPTPRTELSPREAQLMSFLARGKSDAQIGELVGLRTDSVGRSVFVA